ncbi:hypothetical protein RRF57_010817 [Xylaria bambusicola]|uniref:Uncharacterized protein n=1 Tax=Xylaria bambusicola TaxID=326684 RepID=A0AAN7Z334_9PEZI
MSITLSTVQKVPVRPQPAEQCTNRGRAFASDSGSSHQLIVAGCSALTEAVTAFESTGSADLCITFANSTRAKR